MLPPTRLTKLAHDMLHPRGGRVLEYWSPPRPIPLKRRVESAALDVANVFGGGRRAILLAAAVVLFAFGLLLPRPTSGFITLAAYGLFMFAYHYNKPGS